MNMEKYLKATLSKHKATGDRRQESFNRVQEKKMVRLGRGLMW